MLVQAFLANMQGSNKHRFGDATGLLRQSDMQVLIRLLTWRKNTHYLHANAVSQYYFQSKEWQALRGKMARFDGRAHQLMQLLVLNQALRKVEQAEICNKKDVPRLMRCEKTLETLNTMCETIEPAVAYFDMLFAKYSAVISQVPSASKLRKRLLFDGEDNLRYSFRCCWERHSGSIERMNFAETDTLSEFALVQQKLNDALEALRAAALVQQLAVPKPTPPIPKPGQPSQSDEGSAGQVAAEPEPVKGERCLEAWNRMDDVMIVFEATPTKAIVKDGVPDLAGTLPAGSMFVVPASPHSR